ncbi:type II holin [Pseudomonas fontis]|uniref:Type II holin n=1 Tax=Pseudomonas fontis TaxID=2942633 RepID=A0ABT5NL20_9PSED|nr:type II holin [Pseudomonas fontis]MDD0975431.1 type II holin [Pseudomonas fontis]MDD0989206.1 type II holin [Pseudomonas fontis]
MIELNFNEGVVRATPVVAAAGADVASRFAGLTMSDWFYAAAIIYSLTQCAVLVYKTVKGVQIKQEG